MSAEKRTPKSSLHCWTQLFMDLLFWMFALGALGWPSSCHQQCSRNKVSSPQKDSCVCVCVFLNAWNLIFKASASMIHLPFNGCIDMSTVLSRRAHSLFWYRISPAVSSKPYPLSYSRADRMTKIKALVLTNFVCSPSWLPKCHCYLFKRRGDQAHIRYLKITSHKEK